MKMLELIKRMYPISGWNVVRPAGSLVTLKALAPLHNPIIRTLATATEKLYRSNPRRRITSYQSNKTAALAFPFNNEKLGIWQNHPSILLAKSKPLILEHAARRVDLFFYSLVAYYNSRVQPTRGHTELQHGKGRSIANANITQACHSSFFPAFADVVWPMPLGEDDSLKKSILSNTHFMDSLNSTIELPFVNKLDRRIECLGRKTAMEIIQKVSKGDLNPIQGLTLFLQMMSSIFEKIEQSPLHQNAQLDPAACLTPKLQKQLIAIMKKGTLVNKWNAKSQGVAEEYVQLLLRLTPDEKVACQYDKIAAMQIYNKKFMELKKEILVTPSSFVKCKR